MTLELSEREVKVLTTALKFHIREDDCFFDVGWNCYGLQGKEYKDLLKKVEE